MAKNSSRKLEELITSEFIPSSWLAKLFYRFKTLPALVFYRYLWTNSRRLLFSSIFVNYILPIILEMLPWMFSRRKVGSMLRDDRNKIHHNMVNGNPFSPTLVLKFLMMTVIHSALETLDRQLRNRMATNNRLVIRKLVMERILYSELSALEELQLSTQDLEGKITQDITQTLNLFNYTIPGIIGGVYAVVRESWELYKNRSQLDWLAVGRPLLTLGIGKLVALLKYYAFEEREEKALKAASTGVTRLISNAVDGLAEIQINNLQRAQLNRLDSMIDDELTTSFGFGTTLTRIWTALSSRSLLDFITEVGVVHMIMQRRGITHEQYRKIQNDIDHVIRIGRRTWAYTTMARKVFDKQSKIVEVLDLPNFMYEESELLTRLPPFCNLRVSNIRFSYGSGQPFALDMRGEMLIEAGKTYALLGQNRSGKSTLTNIICKLFLPASGELYYNDIPYTQIARMALREKISYVTQKPFIFPGTIRENILIGCPDATHDQVLEAARMAGVLIFASDPAQHRHAAHTHTSALPPHLQMPARPPVPLTLFRSCTQPSADALATPPNTMRKRTLNTPLTSAPLTSASNTTEEDNDNELRRFTPRFREYLAEKSGGHPAHPVLDFELKARGGNVSGGFAQSIALARIFLRKRSSIVILDEATGMMDAWKKREVIMPNLTRFTRKHNMTLIMISHDLSSVQFVDHIFMLEHGRLAAQGSHKHLMLQRASSYLKLVGAEPEMP